MDLPTRTRFLVSRDNPLNKAPITTDQARKMEDLYAQTHNFHGPSANSLEPYTKMPTKIPNLGLALPKLKNPTKKDEPRIFKSKASRKLRVKNKKGEIKKSRFAKNKAKKNEKKINRTAVFVGNAINRKPNDFPQMPAPISTSMRVNSTINPLAQRNNPLAGKPGSVINTAPRGLPNGHVVSMDRNNPNNRAPGTVHGYAYQWMTGRPMPGMTATNTSKSGTDNGWNSGGSAKELELTQKRDQVRELQLEIEKLKLKNENTIKQKKEEEHAKVVNQKLNSELINSSNDHGWQLYKSKVGNIDELTFAKQWRNYRDLGEYQDRESFMENWNELIAINNKIKEKLPNTVLPAVDSKGTDNPFIKFIQKGSYDEVENGFDKWKRDYETIFNSNYQALQGMQGELEKVRKILDFNSTLVKNAKVISDRRNQLLDKAQNLTNEIDDIIWQIHDDPDKAREIINEAQKKKFEIDNLENLAKYVDPTIANEITRRLEENRKSLKNLMDNQMAIEKAASEQRARNARIEAENNLRDNQLQNLQNLYNIAGDSNMSINIRDKILENAKKGKPGDPVLSKMLDDVKNNIDNRLLSLIQNRYPQYKAVFDKLESVIQANKVYEMMKKNTQDWGETPNKNNLINETIDKLWNELQYKRVYDPKTDEEEAANYIYTDLFNTLIGKISYEYNQYVNNKAKFKINQELNKEQPKLNYCYQIIRNSTNPELVNFYLNTFNDIIDKIKNKYINMKLNLPRINNFNSNDTQEISDIVDKFINNRYKPPEGESWSKFYEIFNSKWAQYYGDNINKSDRNPCFSLPAAIQSKGFQ